MAVHAVSIPEASVQSVHVVPVTAGHILQEVCSDWSVYCPFSHSLHVLIDVMPAPESENNPTTQLLQTDAVDCPVPTSLYFPPTHAVHLSEDRPVSLDHFAAKHCLQLLSEESPVTLDHLPSVQSLH